MLPDDISMRSGGNSY